MSAVLDIQGLSLGVRTEAGMAHILDHVDLAVHSGEIMGLVGESGCGKTTLARALLGNLPESGAWKAGGGIRLDGEEMLQGGSKARALRGRVVTFIPQDPLASFNPLFRIGTQIRDLLRAKLPASESPGGWKPAVISMLKAVLLPYPDAILAAYPHQLSTGQRQRVMIALALLPQPRLIIADEPTTALDASTQRQILGLLRRLAAERGAAVLFTTHDLAAAWEVCDRISVMYAGQVVEIAERDRFFTRARHPYSRMLLACLEDGSTGIPGDAPDPHAPSAGCRFAPRCPNRSQICIEARPELAVQSDGDLLACHHPWGDAAAGAHV